MRRVRPTEWTRPHQTPHPTPLTLTQCDDYLYVKPLLNRLAERFTNCQCAAAPLQRFVFKENDLNDLTSVTSSTSVKQHCSHTNKKTFLKTDIISFVVMIIPINICPFDATIYCTASVL